MRKIILSLISLAMFAGMFVGCKTSEANYRAAYELAKKNDTDSIDNSIYTRIRREAVGRDVIVGGDTVKMKSEYVRLTDNGGGSAATFKPYNIVVAQFKQLFNAKSARKRVAEAGYVDAFVVQTREPLYYVVVGSYATPAEAKAALQTIQNKMPFALSEPCPFILWKR